MKKLLEFLEISILLVFIFWVIFGIIDEIKNIKDAKNYSSNNYYIEQSNEDKVLRVEFWKDW